jgi:phosphocarrier protein
MDRFPARVLLNLADLTRHSMAVTRAPTAEHQDEQDRWGTHKHPEVACFRPRPIEPPMSHDPTVSRRTVEITNSLGLHLRPADKFVKLALQYQAEVRVHYNGKEFNGKSILDLTTLAAECGTRLELEARGPDAVAAVEALAELVSARFYENEDGEPVQAPSGAESGR